jgi:hypothetical protein
LAPDGTDYEFRDQATNGQPKAPVSGGFNRGTIFTTADGTTATFISDWTIYETAYGLEPPAPDGYIKLKDGTQFRVDDGTIFSSSYACHMCCPNSVGTHGSIPYHWISLPETQPVFVESSGIARATAH